LSVVASSDLGDLGPSESEPAAVEWQWHYHLPGFAGWALIAVLLIFVRENRNRSAWLILIPFLLLGEVIWPWTVRLFGLSSRSDGDFGLVLHWLLVGWTAIWLLSPWLARRRPAVALVLAAAIMAMVGIAGQLGHLLGAEIPFTFLQRMFLGESIMVYLISAFALLAAFVLSGRSCRCRYSPRRFLARLAPWLFIAIFAGCICVYAWMYLSRYSIESVPPIVPILIRLVVISLCLAGILYLVNLPFMTLAFRCPEYRERFCRILRLPKPRGPASETPPLA
jgi:hypothetical protein